MFCTGTQGIVVTNYTPGVPAIPLTIRSFRFVTPKPLLRAAACHHAVQAISSPFAGVGHFEPLGPTILRSSRHTFRLSPARLGIVSFERFTELTQFFDWNYFQKDLMQLSLKWRSYHSPPLSQNFQSCNAHNMQLLRSLYRNHCLGRNSPLRARSKSCRAGHWSG